MITILDYGVGNIASVQKAFEYLGYSVTVSQNPADIAASQFLVVPGQGAIKQALTALTELRLKEPLIHYLTSNRPFLGICLGFQLLFDHSEEHGGHDGLGILPGIVKRFDNTTKKVPHMGWNQLDISDQYPTLKKALPKNPFVYFVHSYYVQDTSPNTLVATATYEHPIVAAIKKDNLWATQFHPEKSGDVGLAFLKYIVQSSL